MQWSTKDWLSKILFSVQVPHPVIFGHFLKIFFDDFFINNILTDLIKFFISRNKFWNLQLNIFLLFYTIYIQISTTAASATATTTTIAASMTIIVGDVT